VEEDNQSRERYPNALLLGVLPGETHPTHFGRLAVVAFLEAVGFPIPPDCLGMIDDPRSHPPLQWFESQGWALWVGFGRDVWAYGHRGRLRFEQLGTADPRSLGPKADADWL